MKNDLQRQAEREKIYDEFVKKILDNFRTSLGLLDDSKYNTIIFLSLLILNSERMLSNVLIMLFKRGFSSSSNIFADLGNEMIEKLIYELTFTSKIKIYEEIVGKHKCYSDLKKGASFFRELNNIRNCLFHCKLKEIRYKNKDVNKGQTKHLMIEDLLDAVGANKHGN